MHRRIDGEGATDANQDASLSGSGIRRLGNVIAFRRANPAASCGPVAGSDPPSDPAFIPLGHAVAAVVLRLRDGFPRIRVAGPDQEEAEE